jgi:retinol dehydrogenase-12
VTSLWAGTSAEGADLGGKVTDSGLSKDDRASLLFVQYLIPWARVGVARAATEDPEAGRQLWEWAEDQVKNI